MRKLSSSCRSGLLRSSRAVVETCDNRRMFSVVTLTTTSSNDLYVIQISGSSWETGTPSFVTILSNGGVLYGTPSTFINRGLVSSVTGFSLGTSNGDDAAIFSTAFPVPGGAPFTGFNMSGGEGNDVLVGTNRNDIFSGGNGNDFLNGSGGNDTLRGDGNADSLFGQAGNDLLEGGNGDDSLEGGSDDDTLVGGGNADRVFGNGGNDRLEMKDSVVDLINDGGGDFDTGILDNVDPSSSPGLVSVESISRS
jgi:Ca2+-binding RTX toxin-like protein